MDFLNHYFPDIFQIPAQKNYKSQLIIKPIGIFSVKRLRKLQKIIENYRNKKKIFLESYKNVIITYTLSNKHTTINILTHIPIRKVINKRDIRTNINGCILYYNQSTIQFVYTFPNNNTQSILFEFIKRYFNI